MQSSQYLEKSIINKIKKARKQISVSKAKKTSMKIFSYKTNIKNNAK